MRSLKGSNQTLTQHPFVTGAKEPKAVLENVIAEAMEILAKQGRFPAGDDEEEVRMLIEQHPVIERNCK